MFAASAACLIMVASAAAPGSTGTTTGGSATEVVRRLHAIFASALRDADALQYRGRYERLAPAVTEALDSEFMARAVIGRQWRKLGEEDRARWVATFRKFTIANYAARLNQYTGQTFETLGEEPGRNGTVFVRAHVRDPAGEDVDLSYRLRNTAGGWKIIDLYARGTVSELALRRSEYASVLKKDGFEALVTTLNEKVKDLASGKTP